MTVSFPEFIPASSTSQPTGLKKALADQQKSNTARPGRGIYRNGLKRAFDVAAVVLSAPVVLPLIGGLSLAVALRGGAPFYTQNRVGLGGRTFRMWKIRSMVPDAESKLAGYLDQNPEARREWDETQKLRHDPRITPFGRVLRKTSLDELPQLWNVLKGEMSLVGPRPMMTNQMGLYPGSAYYLLRPGLTGHWQTSGRNQTSFEARSDYDSAYEADLSFALDLKILARTVKTVLACTGY